MDQAKRTNDVTHEGQQAAAARPVATEIKTLTELELVLCAGGEQVVIWG